MIAADLTQTEAVALYEVASDAAEWADGTKGVHDEAVPINDAARFLHAWWLHEGDTPISMRAVLNDESLPYRNTMIAHLVSLRLHDTPCPKT